MRILFLLLLSFSVLFADEDNPFSDGEMIESTVEDSLQTTVVIDSTASLEDDKLPFWYGYVQWQKGVNKKLSGLINSLKGSLTAGKILVILVISFLYSILHTAGPGHGKIILSTYFLTTENKHRKNDAVKAALIVSLTHVGSATLLSLFVVLIMHSVSAGTQDGNVLKGSGFFGGILIFITGIIQLLSVFFHDVSGKILLKLLAFIKVDVKSLGWHAFLSGIVPCPLALLVLSFSIAAGVLYIGLLSAVVMALGAALTVGSFGFLAIQGRNFLDEKLHLRKLKVAGKILRVLGALVVQFAGFAMMDLL